MFTFLRIKKPTIRDFLAEKPQKTSKVLATHLIEMKDVSKIYGDIRALDKINFTIDRGEFVSLVGPSGAGKSTLVRLLIREELPTKGEIWVGGRDITKLPYRHLPYYRRKLGVVFQDYKLLPQKTVYENVTFGLEVSEAPDKVIKAKVPKILELVGLAKRANVYPDTLSGGERQRTSIARAMVNSPQIFIADEPTGNLDPVTADEIMRLLIFINQKGATVILATHNKSIVDRLKRRVISLKNGRIVSDEKQGKYII